VPPTVNAKSSPSRWNLFAARTSATFERSEGAERAVSSGELGPRTHAREVPERSEAPITVDASETTAERRAKGGSDVKVCGRGCPHTSRGAFGPKRRRPVTLLTLTLTLT
jgi:hypothetical protein